MSKDRLFLFHWNKAEAEGYANDLRKLGWEVDLEWKDGARGAKAVKQDPPDAVIFYLTRLPSHSQATAEYLRQTKALRELPLIFVDGQDAALDKTRQRIPTGIFIKSQELTKTLEGIEQG